MKAFLNLSDPVSHSSLKETVSNSELSQIVGVFSHHRDAKVAIEELTEAGYPINLVKLIARNCQQYSWLPEIDTYNSFDDDAFAGNSTAQNFFQKLFKKGKYLLLVAASRQEVGSVSSIIGRRRGHSEIWHCQ